MLLWWSYVREGKHSMNFWLNFSLLVDLGLEALIFTRVFPLLQLLPFPIYCVLNPFLCSPNSVGYAPLPCPFRWEMKASRSEIKLFHSRAGHCYGEGAGHMTQWVFLSLCQGHNVMDPDHGTLIGFLKISPWKCRGPSKTAIVRCFLSLQHTINMTI